jgi:hypothetical protein
LEPPEMRIKLLSVQSLHNKSNRVEVRLSHLKHLKF